MLPHLVVKDDISPTNGGSGTDEESRQATLCVFLHGALKVENMCALVQVTNVDNCKECVKIKYGLEYQTQEKQNHLIVAILVTI